MVVNDRKKEKITASSRLRPTKRPARIVAPERETPGKRAKAWKRPMISASPEAGVLQVSSTFFPDEDKNYSYCYQKQCYQQIFLSNGFFNGFFKDQAEHTCGYGSQEDLKDV